MADDKNLTESELAGDEASGSGLRRALQRPTPPPALKVNVFRNWQQQLAQAQVRRIPLDLRVMMACVVLVVVVVVSVIRVNHTPGVVTAALADIQKDKLLKVGLSLPADAWPGEEKTARLLEGMVLKMTKYCTLDGHRTVHYQILGKNRGEVHLFLQQTKFPALFWQKTQGENQSMPWRLLNPAPGLSVLVVYSSDMDVNNVEKLINNLFYA